MIEVVNLSKSYGRKKALEDVSFSVKTGEVLGLLGANGAGKSTLMNIITGYLSASSGTVKIDGYDVLDHPKETKRKIGYLPEQPPLYLDMTVKEYLDFAYDLKKIKGTDKGEHILSILKKIGIEDVYQRKLSNLSKGYKQRVGLAQALLGDPEVLILDEPTVGLDPKQMIEIRTVIQELGKEHTVLLSSHILSEVSAVCERVIIVKNGRVVAEDTPENLSRAAKGPARLVLRVLGDAGTAQSVLLSVPDVAGVHQTAQREDGSAEFELETEKSTDPSFLKCLFYRLADQDLPILMLKPAEATLEDVFIEIITEDTGAVSQVPAEEAVLEERGELTDESDF